MPLDFPGRRRALAASQQSFRYDMRNGQAVSGGIACAGGTVRGFLARSPWLEPVARTAAPGAVVCPDQGKPGGPPTPCPDVPDQVCSSAPATGPGPASRSQNADRLTAASHRFIAILLVDKSHVPTTALFPTSPHKLLALVQSYVTAHTTAARSANTAHTCSSAPVPAFLSATTAALDVSAAEVHASAALSSAATAAAHAPPVSAVHASAALSSSAAFITSAAVESCAALGLITISVHASAADRSCAHVASSAAPAARSWAAAAISAASTLSSVHAPARAASSATTAAILAPSASLAAGAVRASASTCSTAAAHALSAICSDNTAAAHASAARSLAARAARSCRHAVHPPTIAHAAVRPLYVHFVDGRQLQATGRAPCRSMH